MLDNKSDAIFPPLSNCTIWRYLDFTKLLSLLETKTLHFSRADQFDDPYEGMWSLAGVKLLRDPSQNGGIPTEIVEQVIASADRWRQTMFISCWFAAEHESAAMWKLYMNGHEGIAIRSDHDSLASVLHASPISFQTSFVRYIDYDNVPISFSNIIFPFVHKRMSFSHENELRAFAWSEQYQNKPQIDVSATGLKVNIVPADLIKAIHVSPTAPAWFGELIERVLSRYGLSCPVERSRLYDRPSY